MALPGSLCLWLNQQFTTDAGLPLAGGLVEFFNTGLGTHKATYSNADLAIGHVNANPVVLDAGGRAQIFLLTGGYDCTIKDSGGTLIRSISNFEDVGATFLGSLGVTMAGGARAVTSGYTILATDYLVTVNSTGGPNPCLINLPTSASRLQDITIKNLGTVALSIVPNGSDTIDTTLTSFAIPAASSPTFPWHTFRPDGVSTYFVVS